ncbi:trehalose-phosphatase [Mesorhizobium sp. L-8-3]|nr:trehalose-phosphatase [Mesorhizobium sp. L-8-3]
MENRQSVPAGRQTAGSGHSVASGLPSRLAGLCVFLDIDGTLLDLAQTPDAVVVPNGLDADLAGLAARVGGALALVTGRPVDFVETLFPGHGFFVAGLHGAEIRTPGSVEPAFALGVRRFEEAKTRIAEAARNWPGVLVEDKGIAVALHYRLSPASEAAVNALMTEIQRSVPGWELQPGKCVLELRPAGRDKGGALKAFMEHAPFIGRLPLAIGDDVTDEAMFRAANDAGGLSVRVAGAGFPTAARGHVASPAALRAWIAAQSREGDRE